MRDKSEQRAGSLSFLDVIACAFGAIVLLVLILPVGTFGILADSQPLSDALGMLTLKQSVLEEEIDKIEEQIDEKKDLLEEIGAGQAEKTDRLTELNQTIAETEQEIDEVENSISKTSKALVKLLEEEKSESPLEETQSFAGIPVDAEYVAFVIDTSPSMKRIWSQVMREVEGVLSLYPEIKGFQILSADGDYIFRSERRQWMTDNPQRRRLVIANLRDWRKSSRSSPERGILVALKDLYRQDESMALFIFGDDFDSDEDLDEYMKKIDRIVNSAGVKEGSLRIHAIGFENEDYMVHADVRFAVLMSELSRRHNGAFLALPLRERQLRSPR